MQARKAFPRIAIVTPSFNQGRYLSTCIASVATQDYPDVEHIVIDGGSTDESLAVIRQNAARLSYWCSEPDGGQSAGINKGLQRSRGDIVAWLNADDYLLPDALRRVADAYATNDAAPFYFGNGIRVSETGEKSGEFFPRVPVKFDRNAMIYGLNYILQPSTFMSRAALDKAGLLDEGLRWGMDTDLWIRLSALGEPQFVPGLLAATREYEQTKTSTGMFERVEELRQIAKRHSGVEMTPGALCYLLDTLHRYAKQRQDVFDAQFPQKVVEQFWMHAAAQMAKFGARDDGFPSS